MRTNLLFTLCLILFHFLFWKEGMGINLCLFASLLLAYQKVTHQSPFKLSELLYLIPFSLAAIGVVLVNTSVSVVVLVLSFATYSGYLHNQQSSVLENFFSGAISFFSLRQPIFPQAILKERGRKPAGLVYMRIALLPLLLFIVFFALFHAGNAIFRDWSNAAFGNFFSFLDRLDYTYFFFIIFGLLITRWAFLKLRKQPLVLQSGNFLKRKWEPLKTKRHFKTLALKHEYLSALLAFGSLNLLLLAINIIDIKWVWFQFYVPEQFSLKDFVHEGVGWLLVSLILSAALVFFFFRKNLNFFPDKGWLKALAIAWVLQNLILTVSVAIRTFHYIGFHGLASKRITLLLFLSIVAVALVSLAVKVYQKRNAAFTVRWVSAYSLLLFGLCSVINWDALIARVNLNHGMANEIDVDNYLDLNPQVFPTLYANLDRIEYQIERHNTNEVRWINYTSMERFKEALDHRAKAYLRQQQSLGVASWNYADAEASHALKARL